MLYEKVMMLFYDLLTILVIIDLESECDRSKLEIEYPSVIIRDF